MSPGRLIHRLILTHCWASTYKGIACRSKLNTMHAPQCKDASTARFRSGCSSGKPSLHCDGSRTGAEAIRPPGRAMRH